MIKYGLIILLRIELMTFLLYNVACMDYDEAITKKVVW